MNPESGKTTDDRELATGDSRLATLLENHSRFLGFLERRLGSRDEAEDLLQDALVKSLDRAPPLAGEAVNAWFYRVLRNALTDHYRRQGKWGRAVTRLAAESPDSAEPDAELEAAACPC